jgi:hypothetical protein
VIYGAGSTLSATVTSTTSGTPTGQVLFVDGVTPLNAVTLAGAAAQTTQVLGAGTHSVTAVYSGDTNFAGSTSVPVSLTVTAATPAVSVVAGAGSLTYGSSTSLTATVAASGSGSAPTGSVSFFDGAVQAGSGTLNGAGVAVATVTPGAGTHSYTAHYLGNANYAAAVSASSGVSVATAVTTTTLGVSGGTAYGNPATLVATIMPSVSTAGPTGTVTFYDGTTAVGSGTLSGTMATTSALLGPGTHSLTAKYGGDSNFSGSTSAAAAVTVVVPLVVSATPASLSLAAGASGTTSVSIAPAGGFTGTVTLACASPVSYISCSLTPATQAISGTAAVMATLNVQVAASVGQLAAPGGRPQGRDGRGWLAGLLPLGMIVIARRRRWLRGSIPGLACLAMLGLLAAASGCGGSALPGAASNLPTAGTQAVTVTATTGVVSASTSVNVVVTN